MSTKPLANYATGLGVYDASINGTSVVSETSSSVPLAGSFDLSLNAGFVSTARSYLMPPAVSSNGISLCGWFWPFKSQASSAPIVNISTNGAPIAVYLSGSGIYTRLAATYNNAIVILSDPSYTVTVNAWNFFSYTIECSGSTMAVQSLSLNGGVNKATDTTAMYVPQVLAASFFGMGIGPFASQFQGKLDDIRCMNRVIRPMEYRVLYGYSSYAAVPATPTVSLSSGSTQYNADGSISSNTLSIDASSTFSHLTVSRTPAFTSGSATRFVSAATLKRAGTKWTWTDTSVNQTGTVSYSLVPYVMGFPAQTGAMTITESMPTIVSVSTLVSNTSVTLNVTGIFYGFTVSRNGTPIATVANATTYKDSGLTTKVTYTYTVTPFGRSGVVGTPVLASATTVVQVKMYLKGYRYENPLLSYDGIYWFSTTLINGGSNQLKNTWGFDSIIYGTRIVNNGPGWLGYTIDNTTNVPLIYSSVDGIFWSLVTISSPTLVYGITWRRGALSTDGVGRVIIQTQEKKLYYFDNGNYTVGTPCVFDTNINQKMNWFSEIKYRNNRWVGAGCIIGNLGLIVYSDDGINFKYVTSSAINTNNFIFSVEYFPLLTCTSKNINGPVWLAGAQNAIHASTDNGLTWTTLVSNANFGGVNSIDTDGGGLNFTTNSSGFYYTRDGFNTMTNGSTNPMGSLISYAGKIAFDQNMVTSSSGITPLPVVNQVYDIFINPMNYFSPDFGKTWKTVPNMNGSCITTYTMSNTATVQGFATAVCSDTLAFIIGVNAQYTSSTIKIYIDGHFNYALLYRGNVMYATVYPGALGQTIYIDSNVSLGTTYYYQLIPFNANDVSANPLNFGWAAVATPTKGTSLVVPPPIVANGLPTFYYPFWSDTKNYANGTTVGISDAVANGGVQWMAKALISTTFALSPYVTTTPVGGCLISIKSGYGGIGNFTMPNVTLPSTGGFSVAFNLFASGSGANFSTGTIWRAGSNTNYIALMAITDYVTLRTVINGVVTDRNLYLSSAFGGSFIFHWVFQFSTSGYLSSYRNGALVDKSYFPTFYTALPSLSNLAHYLFLDDANPGNIITKGTVNNFYFFPRLITNREIDLLYSQ